MRALWCWERRGRCALRLEWRGRAQSWPVPAPFWPRAPSISISPGPPPIVAPRGNSSPRPRRASARALPWRALPSHRRARGRWRPMVSLTNSSRAAACSSSLMGRLMTCGRTATVWTRTAMALRRPIRTAMGCRTCANTLSVAIRSLPMWKGGSFPATGRTSFSPGCSARTVPCPIPCSSMPIW